MGARTSKRKQRENSVHLAQIKEDLEKMANYSIEGTKVIEGQIGQGGVYYYFDLEPDKESKDPPKILQRHYKNQRPSTENLKELADDLEEKMMIANILREDNIQSRVKAARELNERPAKVLERKNQLYEEKIQKTQEKLLLDEVRLLNRPRMNRPRLQPRPTPIESRSDGTSGQDRSARYRK